MDEILHDINRSTVSTKLDIKWAFHQVELSEESRKITTSATHKGLFRYKGLIFEISCTPEMYQRVMRQVYVRRLRKREKHTWSWWHHSAWKDSLTAWHATWKSLGKDPGKGFNPEQGKVQVPQVWDWVYGKFTLFGDTILHWPRKEYIANKSKSFNRRGKIKTIEMWCWKRNEEERNNWIKDK